MEYEACPFCGKTESLRLIDSNEFKCENCKTLMPQYTIICDMTQKGCGAVGGYRDTESDAVEAWNKRTA